MELYRYREWKQGNKTKWSGTILGMEFERLMAVTEQLVETSDILISC